MGDRAVRSTVAAARLAVCLGVALAAASARAQPYTIPWSTVDGGGGMAATGGPFVLGGTIGQPDAGGPFTGGAFELRGGFWAFAAGGVAPTADLSVTKTDGQATAVPGLPVTYTIVVTNAGPTAATGASVVDVPPAALTGLAWTCSASSGSSCPASGTGPINHTADVAVGGTLTYTLAATVAPDAVGTLTNVAAVTVPSGVVDPDPLDNSAQDVDTLTPQADLAVTIADAPDPVVQGGLLTYTLQLANTGPSLSAGMTVTQALPAQAAFVSATPGAPSCTHAAGTVTCTLGALSPAAGTTVTVSVAVGAAVTGSITTSAAVAGTTPDPATANNSDTESTAVLARAEGELQHGTTLLADLAAAGAADVDLYRIHQEPHTSYEVVVDGTSGDIGTGQGPALERVAADLSTVVQTAEPVGAGPSRSLRWMNASSVSQDGQLIRVRSQQCGTDCGSDDVYRVRAWDTTYTIPRFNNSASQVSVVMLQNRGAAPVGGRVYFWSVDGVLLFEAPFSLPPNAQLTLNSSTVPPLVGLGGSITVASDGSYGALAGKAVAVEPATGLAFDSFMEPRLR